MSSLADNHLLENGMLSGVFVTTAGPSQSRLSFHLHSILELGPDVVACFELNVANSIRCRGSRL